jgi:AcrR family transcriptional regulator
VAQDKITREKIIAAVLETAFYKSAEGTSLADIASRVGIKKASLYNHFAKREAIFEAVCGFCGEYMAANPFIPHDYESTIQKYAPSVVLKGIVRRYIKVYEKDLPLYMYTFIASEKYFSKEAFAVFRNEQKKIISQIDVLFNALKDHKKISPAFDPVKDAFWFASAVCNYTASSLLSIKHASSDLERQAAFLPHLAEIDSHIAWFCARNDAA